jgi:diphthamide synthase (EF-2-diphthine--ammonia ligase)
VGIDLCGEEGEYHTVVVDGPIFSEPLQLAMGEPALYDGYWFLDTAI